MLADIPRNRQADQSHPSHALPSAPTWQPLDVLELAQEAIVVRNADGGTIRFWNRSAELLYGWTRQEALGQVAHRLLATQFPLPLCQIEAELRDTGRWQGELIHTTPDGRRLTVASRWILQRDEQGRPSACVELGTDVTDRGLAAIIASAYDAIYGKDLDGTITSWNPAAERLYGYAASEAIGQSIELIVPPDRVQELAGLMRRSHQDERIEDWETVRRCKGGQLVDVSISISPLTDATGRVVGAATITRDISERKRAQRWLRESEERFRTAFDQVAVGMAHLAPDGRRLQVNQRFCDLLGYTREELLHGTFQELTHPDDLPRDLDHLQRLLAGEITSYQRENRYLRKNGSIMWANLITTLVRGVEGEPTHFVAVIEDITERKEAEAALRASERRYQRLIDSNIVGITISNLDGHIMDANDALLQLVGYSREDLERGLLRWDVLTPPEYLPLDDRAIARARRSGAAAPWEKEYIRKDGTRVPVLIGFAVLDEAAGTIVAFILDLTERKQAENRQRALAEASRAFAAVNLQLPVLFDTVAQYVAERLGDGSVLYVLSEDGERLEPMSLYDPDPEARAIARELFAEAPRRTNEGLVGRVIETEQSLLMAQLSSDEVRLLARPDQWPVLERFGIHSFAAAPLCLKGRVVGVLGVWRRTPRQPYTADDLVLLEDLADRAALSIDNARLHQHVEAAVRVRDDVLGAVSHDLKNPITAIKFESQLLARRVERRGMVDPESLVEGLRHIDAMTRRMTGWIDELLDVARLHTGQELALERAPTDLVELARQAVSDHQRAAPQHRLNLTTAVGQLVGAYDAPRVRRVLDNLLSNAVKYSPAGCDVGLELSRVENASGMWAVLRVVDRGMGIPAADQPRIFERFQRGANVIGRIAGTGIGLAGAARIVELHMGRIEVHSQEGEGSTFTVWLPLAAATPSATP